VGELVALLGQEPLKIMTDLMETGVFASVRQMLDFKTVFRIARKYGYTAKKPA
jgi:hypothetical protein